MELNTAKTNLKKANLKKNCISLMLKIHKFETKFQFFTFIFKYAKEFRFFKQVNQICFIQQCEISYQFISFYFNSFVESTQLISNMY